MDKSLDATFVEDASERWIIIECRDAFEKQRIVVALRDLLALCPHGLPVADNVCGPCSEGRPNRHPVSATEQQK